MKRGTGILIAASLIMVGFAGCGKKPEPIDYTGDEATKSDADLAPSARDSLKERFDAGEKWEKTVSPELGKRIDAAVDIPDVSKMKVIRMREKYYNEEEKKEFLSKLTDETVYKYDDVSMPKHEIEQLIEEMQEEIDSIGPDTNNEDAQANIEWCYEMIEEYQTLYENAPDDWVAADDYSGNIYVFYQGDIKYMAYFMSGISGDNVLQVRPKEAADVYADCPYEQVYMDPATKIDMVTKENECGITAEQAQETAEEYLKNLGIGDFSVADIYPLFLSGKISYYESEGYMNGYVVMFYRNLDGIVVEGDRYDYALDSKGEYGMEKILVSVNDGGVIGMDYFYPYELGEVMSEDAALLSYDIIKEAFVEEITAREEYEHITFEKLSLMYYPVRNDENADEYTLVPAWRLTDGECYGEINDYIVLNAIDGSLIYTSVMSGTDS